MEKYEELLKAFEKADPNNLILVKNTLEEMIFIEKKLEYLKTLPFIKVHKEKPELQKATPAAKQYKELMQNYLYMTKILVALINKINFEEDDAFSKFLQTVEERRQLV